MNIDTCRAVNHSCGRHWQLQRPGLLNVSVVAHFPRPLFTEGWQSG